MPIVVGIGNMVGGIAGSNDIEPRPSSGFKFNMETSNVSSGSSGATSFKLPLGSGGTYNFDIDWGDGSSDTITAYNQSEVTHVYASSGAYLVEITGTCEYFSFGNGGDKLKILDVENWGGTNLTINARYAFWGCANLTSSATDSPTVSGDISFMFKQCPALVSGLAGWDMSNVTSLISFLSYATAFNEDISGWNISGVTTFSNFLRRVSSFSTANYDALLIGWSAQTVQTSVTFTCNTQYTSGGTAEAARTTLTSSPQNWSITDAGAA